MAQTKKASPMIKEFFPVLENTNPHSRDGDITLDHDTHIYTIKGYPSGAFKSVTSWKEERFPEFDADEIIEKMQSRPSFKESKYAGMTNTEIKLNWTEKAALGRWFHRDIEGFLNDNSLPPGYTNGDLFRLHAIAWYEEEDPNIKETKEWRYFMSFVRNYANLVPFRTEWMIYHEGYRIVGTIDCVYSFKSNTGETKYAIFDWKRTEKKICRSKYYDGKLKDKSLGFMRNNSYWQYAIQLNLYRIILMDKYGITSDHLYILRLHPNSAGYQLVRMPILEWVLRPLLEGKKN